MFLLKELYIEQVLGIQNMYISDKQIQSLENCQYSSGKGISLK